MFKQPHTRSSLVLTLIGIILALSGALGVHAQEQAVLLGIKPVGVPGSYFALTLEPGETRELTVELANYGTTEIRAHTYAADAYSIINGGFGARYNGEPIGSPTNWLDYTEETLNLEARTGVRRTFHVRVPEQVAPGDYITSLAIQNADAQPANSTGIEIRQVLRQVIAVAIHIPGPQQPRAEIGAATYRTVAGTSLVAVVVKNTGNIHLKPTGEFILYDTHGAEVSRYPIAMDTLYAGTSTFIEVPFAGRLNPGNYTIVLHLADETHKVQADTRPLPLDVPALESDGIPGAIGSVPQPAAINQTPLTSAADATPIFGLLAGAILLSSIVLFGAYRYRNARRRQA